MLLPLWNHFGPIWNLLDLRQNLIICFKALWPRSTFISLPFVVQKGPFWIPFTPWEDGICQNCTKPTSHTCILCNLKEKKIVLTSLKQTCNEYLIKFSENQSAPKLESRKTSPCSPCAPNLLHVLVSRIPGYHNLCSPVVVYIQWIEEIVSDVPPFLPFKTRHECNKNKVYSVKRHCPILLGLKWWASVQCFDQIHLTVTTLGFFFSVESNNLTKRWKQNYDVPLLALTGHETSVIYFALERD